MVAIPCGFDPRYRQTYGILAGVQRAGIFLFLFIFYVKIEKPPQFQKKCGGRVLIFLQKNCFAYLFSDTANAVSKDSSLRKTTENDVKKPA